MEDKSQALGWLLELEVVNDPNVSNSLILNIYKVSNRIFDVELLIDNINKKVLIYLKLDYWGKIFKLENHVAKKVDGMILEVLPSFKTRVIYDKKLFEKAQEIAKRGEKQWVKKTKKEFQKEGFIYNYPTP